MILVSWGFIYDMGLGMESSDLCFLTSQVTKDSRVWLLSIGLIYKVQMSFRFLLESWCIVHGLKASLCDSCREVSDVVLLGDATFRLDFYWLGDGSGFVFRCSSVLRLPRPWLPICMCRFVFAVCLCLRLRRNLIWVRCGLFVVYFSYCDFCLLPRKNLWNCQQAGSGSVFPVFRDATQERRSSDWIARLWLEVVYIKWTGRPAKGYLPCPDYSRCETIWLRVSEQEFQRSRVEILSGLMRLRQICDTPALFMEDYLEPVAT